MNILYIEDNFNNNLYRDQLNKVSEYIYTYFLENNSIKELSVLTDELFMQEKNLCDGGLNSYTLVNDGKLYVCPEFYFEFPSKDIGNIEEGIKSKYNQNLYSEEFSPLCKECKICHCNSCSFDNYIKTSEVNIPSRATCIKASIEFEVSEKLQKMMTDQMKFYKKLEPLYCKDPFITALERNAVNGLLDKNYLED